MNLDERPAASGRREELAPLRNPCFRKFWIAGIISNSGSWMQYLAVPIAVYQVTGKARWIGITSMAGLLPALAANIFAGTIADRFERRFVLLITQFALALSALVMWWIFGAAHPSLIAICAIVGLSAFLSGISMTSWQSFVPSLVPREQLGAAVRLNSLQFAMARSLGPLLAAFAIARFGPRIGFVANALSYAAVLVVLATFPKVPAPTGLNGSKENPLRAIANGWRYVASHRSLAMIPLINLSAAVFAFSFAQLTSPITVDLFHRPKTASTWLNVGFGVGGIAGMIVVGAIGEKVRRSRLVPFGLWLWCAGMAMVAFAPSFLFAAAAFSVIGASQVTVSSSINTALQMQVAEEYRGRALGLYMMSMTIGTPLGALVFGSVIDSRGSRIALLVAGGILAALSALLGRVGLADLDLPEPSGPFCIRTKRRQLQV